MWCPTHKLYFGWRRCPKCASYKAGPPIGKASIPKTHAGYSPVGESIPIPFPIEIDSPREASEVQGFQGFGGGDSGGAGASDNWDPSSSRSSESSPSSDSSSSSDSGGSSGGGDS